MCAAWEATGVEGAEWVVECSAIGVVAPGYAGRKYHRIQFTAKALRTRRTAKTVGGFFFAFFASSRFVAFSARFEYSMEGEVIAPVRGRMRHTLWGRVPACPD